MQLSFLDQIPTVSKTFFLDVFAESLFDIKTNKMKLKTINGQQVPMDMKVSLPSRCLEKFPEGTIIKVDTKLIEKEGRKPYFVAIQRKNVSRAIEFFEYNLKLQYGFDFKYSRNK